MGKTVIELPKKVHFSTELTVRITDLNYGNHLGNHAIAGLLHEARVAMLAEYGLNELNIGNNTSLIQGDLVIVFKNEGHYGHKLLFELSIDEMTNASFDVYYHVKNQALDKTLALAKTRMVCFDYENKKTKGIPESFRNTFKLNP